MPTKRLHDYRARTGLGQLRAVLALLAGGVAAGGAVGAFVAPDSVTGVVLSAVMLPVALFAGVTSWLGTATAVLVMRLAGFGGSHQRARAQEEVPPGAVVFVPVAIGVAAVTALLVAVLSEEATLIRIGVPYVAVGATYGVVAWRLARLGYLPAPDGT